MTPVTRNQTICSTLSNESYRSSGVVGPRREGFYEADQQLTMTPLLARSLLYPQSSEVLNAENKKGKD